MASMKKSRKNLAVVWLVGSGVLILILVLQTILGRYDAPSKPEDAFAWLLPTILPTLSLILGVLAADAANATEPDRRVDSFMYRLTLTLSIVYLVIVSLTIFLAPFSSRTPIELMKTSNLWLGPLQGIIAAVIGVFFVKKTAQT